VFFVLYLVLLFPIYSIIPSVYWCCWLGLLTCKGKENPYRKPVSEMTYNVFGGTLNPAQPSTTTSCWYTTLFIWLMLAYLVQTSVTIYIFGIFYFSVYVTVIVLGRHVHLSHSGRPTVSKRTWFLEWRKAWRLLFCRNLKGVEADQISFSFSLPKNAFFYFSAEKDAYIFGVFYFVIFQYKYGRKNNRKQCRWTDLFWSS